MKESITVAKFGSELVTDSLGVSQDKISGYASALAETYGEGGLVVVTSGAVAAGKRRVERCGDSAEGWSDITLAQLGSATITHAWEVAFDNVGVRAGGLLITHHEIQDRQEGPSLIRAMRLALEKSVVSVVNENDALSNDELMKLACGGDNDGLASHIARVIGADTLQLFTRGGGIVDEDGSLIDEINRHNYEHVRHMLKERAEKAAREGKDGVGRGGMVSKLEAGWAAAKAGVAANIAATNGNMTGEFVTKIVLG